MALRPRRLGQQRLKEKKNLSRQTFQKSLECRGVDGFSRENQDEAKSRDLEDTAVGSHMVQIEKPWTLKSNKILTV